MSATRTGQQLRQANGTSGRVGLARKFNSKRARLDELLRLFGVRVVPVHGNRHSIPSLSAATEGQLWDWFERAKLEYRKRIVHAHPDKGGSQEEAAALNTAWQRLCVLFSRRGIGAWLVVISAGLLVGCGHGELYKNNATVAAGGQALVGTEAATKSASQLQRAIGQENKSAAKAAEPATLPTAAIETRSALDLAPTVVVRPPKTVSIYWNHPLSLPQSNLTFEIYHATSLPRPASGFTWLTNATMPPVTVAASSAAEFFIVRASNTETHLVSDWASK